MRSNIKKIIFLICIYPAMVFGQDDVYSSGTNDNKKKVILSEGVQDSIGGTSFVLKENVIIFQRIYKSQLNKEELINELKTFLPSIKSFQLSTSTNQTNEQFSGRLTDFIVNYRKYGGSLMGTAIILNYPLNANVIVQVKDNKYRVIISDILFKSVKLGINDTGTDILADDFFTRKKRTAISSNSIVLKGASYMNFDFDDAFNLLKAKKIKSDF